MQNQYMIAEIDQFAQALNNNEEPPNSIRFIIPYSSDKLYPRILKLFSDTLRSDKLTGREVKISLYCKESTKTLDLLNKTLTSGVSFEKLTIENHQHCDKDTLSLLLQCVNLTKRPPLHLLLTLANNENKLILENELYDPKVYYTAPVELTITEAYRHAPDLQTTVSNLTKKINDQVESNQLTNKVLELLENNNFSEALDFAKKLQDEQNNYYVIWKVALKTRDPQFLMEISEKSPFFEESRKLLSVLTERLHQSSEYLNHKQLEMLYTAAYECNQQHIMDVAFHRLSGKKQEDPVLTLEKGPKGMLSVAKLLATNNLQLHGSQSFNNEMHRKSKRKFSESEDELSPTAKRLHAMKIFETNESFEKSKPKKTFMQISVDEYDAYAKYTGSHS